MTSGTEYTAHKNEAKAEVMRGTLHARSPNLKVQAA